MMIEDVKADRALQLVLFHLDGSSYSLPVEQVAEVVRVVAWEKLPQTPSWLLGMINLRGRVVPVIDLRARLGLRAREIDASTPIIVVRDGDRMAGLIADAVEDMITVEQGQIEATANTSLVSGVVRFDGQLLFLMQLDALLDEAAQHTEGR